MWLQALDGVTLFVISGAHFRRNIGEVLRGMHCLSSESGYLSAIG